MRTASLATPPRALIDAFIVRLSEAGRKISRKDIWTAAGYKGATEFQRFQRSDTRKTKSAAKAFDRILNMGTVDFIALLDKKSPPK